MLLYETVQTGPEPYAAVTGVRLPAADIVVPARTKDGMPVLAIAPHAFAGADGLRSVTLPDSIVSLGNFAFHNCRALRTVTLHDSVTDYGDGVIRQCTALSDVRLTVRAENYALPARMLADSDNTLTFVLTLPDGEAHLTFPGFNYDFTENTMARTIQFNIEGSGMAFRECVTRAGIDYDAYDRMFHRAKLDDITITSNLVLNRLTHPYALSAQAKDAYEDYVRAHAEDVLKTLITDHKTEQLRFLTDAAHAPLLSAEALKAGIAHASGDTSYEIISVLTECMSRHYGHSRKLTFTLQP